MALDEDVHVVIHGLAGGAYTVGGQAQLFGVQGAPNRSIR